ncbi:MAG: MerC domain-containing protein [Sandaracinaceae bacterium]|nr:MerC domain-containing protein [Sandaracinaceae bacterium]
MLGDRVGIVASSACAVHCVAGAVLAGAAGVAGAIADERVELALLVVALGIAALVLGSSYAKHRDARPALLALGALAPLALARALEWEPEGIEVALSVLGAACLVGAHVLNLRATRRAHACAAP